MTNRQENNSVGVPQHLLETWEPPLSNRRRKLLSWVRELFAAVRIPGGTLRWIAEKESGLDLKADPEQKVTDEDFGDENW